MTKTPTISELEAQLAEAKAAEAAKQTASETAYSRAKLAKVIELYGLVPADVRSARDAASARLSDIVNDPDSSLEDAYRALAIVNKAQESYSHGCRLDL